VRREGSFFPGGSKERREKKKKKKRCAVTIVHLWTTKGKKGKKGKKKEGSRSNSLTQGTFIWEGASRFQSGHRARYNLERKRKKTAT